MSYALDLPRSHNLSKVQRTRKKAILLVSLPAIACFPFIRSVWAWDGPVQEWIENIGFALVLIAIIGRCWSTLYIGGRKTKELVVRGPFSMVRNPLYFFSFVGAIGMGACSGSVVLALLFFVIAFIIFRSVVGYEEAALLDTFGAPYRDYCRRVPRFIPNLSLWSDERRLEIEPVLVARTLIDAAPFILAMPMFELIGQLQLDGVLPVMLYLP